jgi:hypothetical protein
LDVVHTMIAVGRTRLERPIADERPSSNSHAQLPAAPAVSDVDAPRQ